VFLARGTAWHWIEDLIDPLYGQSVRTLGIRIQAVVVGFLFGPFSFLRLWTTGGRAVQACLVRAKRAEAKLEGRNDDPLGTRPDLKIAPAFQLKCSTRGPNVILG
jgi:hypothetical protein